MKRIISSLLLVCCVSYYLAGCSAKGDSGKSVKEMVSRGREMAGKAQTQDALEEFEAAVKLDPKNAGAYYELGALYYKMKELKKAEDSINGSLKISPDNPMAYNMLGLIYQDLGLFDKAKESFDQALRIDKNFQAARANVLSIGKAKKNYNDYRFIVAFIDILSREYSNGNNSFIRGVNETKVVKNEFGNVLGYDVSFEIYLAREYLDKCSKLLEEIADKPFSENFSEALDTFSDAIEQRKEAIDLQLQAYGSNGSDMAGFEKSKAKTVIADTYYVDVAKKLEKLMEDNQALFDAKDLSNMKYLIAYYSRKEKSQEAKELE